MCSNQLLIPQNILPVAVVCTMSSPLSDRVDEWHYKRTLSFLWLGNTGWSNTEETLTNVSFIFNL